MGSDCFLLRGESIKMANFMADYFDRIFLGALAGIIILIYLIRVCTKQKARNLEVYQALSSPTVRNAANAFDKRIALATREAAKGFRVCPGCGFDNVQRGVACVLCGAFMGDKTKSRGRFFGRDDFDKAADFKTSPSRRQRRIRRRKEWTRRIQDDGAIVWQQSASRKEVAVLPSYVLQTPALRVVESEVVEEPSPQPPTSGHCAVDVTKDDLGKSLPSSTTPTRTPVEVKDGDIALVGNLGGDVPGAKPDARALDSVRDAQLDFPTKLAHFITATAALFRETTHEGSADEIPVSRFHVLRGSLVEDSVEAIASLTPAESRGAIRVEFAGEQGIDAGGVYREWVQLMNQAIVTPEAGIFTCVNAEDQAFYLHSQARDILGDDYQSHFLVAGRLVGRALLEGNATGFHLSLPLLKIIVGLPVGFDDLEYYDPDVYKNLKWLVEHDGVDALCLDFTAVEKLPDGKSRTVELVPGGSEIEVTDANKLEYIDRKLRYLLFESVAGQLGAFLQGLYEVVPLEALIMLDAEELDFVLCGSDEIDVDDWEAHTLDEIVIDGPTRNRLRNLPCYDNFWKVVRELSVDERRRLLQFATGSTRPPPGGFGSLTSYDGRLSLFTLRGVSVGTTGGNLRSHACFNRLDLPMHWGFDRMRAAVHAAISGEVDGFTID